MAASLLLRVLSRPTPPACARPRVDPLGAMLLLAAATGSLLLTGRGVGAATDNPPATVVLTWLADVDIDSFVYNLDTGDKKEPYDITCTDVHELGATRREEVESTMQRTSGLRSRCSRAADAARPKWPRRPASA